MRGLFYSVCILVLLANLVQSVQSQTNSDNQIVLECEIIKHCHAQYSNVTIDNLRSQWLILHIWSADELGAAQCILSTTRHYSNLLGIEPIQTLMNIYNIDFICQ